MQNKQKFSLTIEAIVAELNIPYMEAIVHHCEKTGMELETAAKLINTKIKGTVASEASDLNMMKEKICKLPL